MQVVGYDAAVEDDAALLVAAGGEVRRESLAPGRELSYTLGERRCAGALTEDGHRPCDRPAAPYCEQHVDTWACARCTGDCDLPLESCREEHAVYLAAFAPDTFKVGVTRSWRLERRLREQGADCAAHIRTVKDGRVARQLEAEWAERVPDRVRVPDKVAGLHESVDEAAWAALLSEFTVEGRFEFDYGLDLSARPVAETRLAGTVRGTKGRVLVLDRAGGTSAVDMRDLVGHELAEGKPDRDVQASLDAY